MALTVGEIMNRELFTVQAHDRADDALATLVAMGLSAAPVIDRERRPIGIVSWRDLVTPAGGQHVEPRMSRAVEVLRPGDRIEHAAARLAAGGFHHAPVVDGEGRVVGFVSALDLLRAFVGQPTPHPAGFPHFDEATGVVWTDDHPLTDAHLDAAPDAPGVLALVEGGRGCAERVIAVEETHNLRARLLDLVSEPTGRLELDRALSLGTLRYRAAAVDDARRRAAVARLMRQQLAGAWFERI